MQKMKRKEQFTSFKPKDGKIIPMNGSKKKIESKINVQETKNTGRFIAFKPGAEKIIPMPVAKEYIDRKANVYKKTVDAFKLVQFERGDALKMKISDFITKLWPTVHKNTLDRFGDTPLTKPITDGITCGILVQLRKDADVFSVKFSK